MTSNGDTGENKGRPMQGVPDQMWAKNRKRIYGHKPIKTLGSGCDEVTVEA
jgi:hypothetical protein